MTFTTGSCVLKTARPTTWLIAQNDFVKSSHAYEQLDNSEDSVERTTWRKDRAMSFIERRALPSILPNVLSRTKVVYSSRQIVYVVCDE